MTLSDRSTSSLFWRPAQGGVGQRCAEDKAVSPRGPWRWRRWHAAVAAIAPGLEDRTSRCDRCRLAKVASRRPANAGGTITEERHNFAVDLGRCSVVCIRRWRADKLRTDPESTYRSSKRQATACFQGRYRSTGGQHVGLPSRCGSARLSRRRKRHGPWKQGSRGGSQAAEPALNIGAVRVSEDI